MSPAVLGHLTLGYQLVWNRLRQPVAVQLFIEAGNQGPVDAVHLLAALARDWSEQSPTLILRVANTPLLIDLLQYGKAGGPWIGVSDEQLADPVVAAMAQQAQLRGLQLAWQGANGHPSNAGTVKNFVCRLITLDAGQALQCLRVSLRKHQDAQATSNSQIKSPIVADQIYESVPSRILVEHCLDEQAAWGVAGWPMEDVLHGYRHHQVQPCQRAIVRLVEATDADAPMEEIEQGLAQEPVLAYRFLRFANSAAFGLRSGIESLRHGLMVLGLSTFRNWLLQQLPNATSDLNLQPIRTSMALRARLMEYLLEAGEEDKLRREVHLCGMLSQIDLVLGEPTAAALQRLVLSDRITDAILSASGPYAPFLEIASALEYPNMGLLPGLCESHQIALGDVNRVLLRVLARTQPQPPKGRLMG